MYSLWQRFVAMSFSWAFSSILSELLAFAFFHNTSRVFPCDFNLQEKASYLSSSSYISTQFSFLPLPDVVTPLIFKNYTVGSFPYGFFFLFEHHTVTFNTSSPSHCLHHSTFYLYYDLQSNIFLEVYLHSLISSV